MMTTTTTTTTTRVIVNSARLKKNVASIHSTTIPKLRSESSGPEDNTPGGPMDYSCEETHDGCGIWVPRATTALFISPLCIKKNEQEVDIGMLVGIPIGYTRARRYLISMKSIFSYDPRRRLEQRRCQSSRPFSGDILFLEGVNERANTSIDRRRDLSSTDHSSPALWSS
ncbi:hypothetical protein HZH66_010990 [Vespula vulgaris]|uniref:Uncharacterized protein n=1 Tax=Vespula vulgaris TaxID=7454 RepID=A0A834JH31_VESVU|nr:hypothetical protein HZH66_010990 [Vespula vulgaris]